MPKITDIIKELSVTKTEFKKIYENATGKKLSASEKEISATEHKKILTEIEGGNKANKALKTEELSFGNDFLSGLGFDEPTKTEPVSVTKTPEKNLGRKAKRTAVVQEKVEQQKREEEKLPKPKEEDEVYKIMKEKIESSGNTFIKKDFSGSHFKKPTQPQTWKNDHTKNFTKKPAGNIEINKSKTPIQPVFKKEKEAKTSSTLIKKEAITLGAKITVKEFSEKLGVPLSDVIRKLLENKIIMGINGVLDFDTASLIAEDMGVKVTKGQEGVSVETLLEGNLQSIITSDKESTHLEERPPIITIMGHVDHGKTKLLDYLRKTNIVAGEAGGITQSIGASQIIHNNKKITFIDTPGHQLFSALRARGSKITDIVIIVVAADEGMKQQTIEAISHAKDAGVPIIVAITKIDKPNGQFELIKTQMAEQGLIPEERGGTIPITKISAVSGEGIDELLDIILIQAELLGLTYDPKRGGVGIVLDAHKDMKQGVATSVLVMTGTMKIGDVIVVHNTYGKIKRLIDRQNKETKLVRGGDPVIISGLKEIPEPGRIIEVVPTEKVAQERILQIQESHQQQAGGFENLLSKINEGQNVQVKIVIKADGRGSLEALKQAINHLTTPENISLKIIHADIGDFNDSDLALAHASNAILLGFSVGTNLYIKKKAESFQLNLKTFDVIYELIEYVEKLAEGMVKKEEKEVLIGKLNILRVFYRKANDMIIGCKVLEGKVKNNAIIKLIRNEEIVAQGKITSLQKEQNNVPEMSEGHECGLKIKMGKKVEENDILECYVME